MIRQAVEASMEYNNVENEMTPTRAPMNIVMKNISKCGTKCMMSTNERWLPMWTKAPTNPDPTLADNSPATSPLSVFGSMRLSNDMAATNSNEISSVSKLFTILERENLGKTSELNRYMESSFHDDCLILIIKTLRKQIRISRLNQTVRGRLTRRLLKNSSSGVEGKFIRSLRCALLPRNAPPGPDTDRLIAPYHSIDSNCLSARWKNRILKYENFFFGVARILASLSVFLQQQAAGIADLSWFFGLLNKKPLLIHPLVD
ncbi:unnamed protein product [Nesidiocoris tenuis]|uniref:Uncharacterized protein n=1 Tax=Nesidiocoris tenuis TaxID=355587 RepID=A0A6H5HLS3_9HEMI|nr:unnamed protein product [Nesidiocoris tenuis]